MRRFNKRRSALTLLPLLLALFLFLFAQADFAHAEKTRFDLAQMKAPPGFHISVLPKTWMARA